MPPFGQADLRVFFGTGVSVSFRGISTYPDGVAVRGLFDRPMELKLAEQGFGGVDVAMPELRLPVMSAAMAAFNPMPTNKDTVTVDGTDYRVADTHAEDDGQVLAYELKAVPV